MPRANPAAMLRKMYAEGVVWAKKLKARHSSPATLKACDEENAALLAGAEAIELLEWLEKTNGKNRTWNWWRVYEVWKRDSTGKRLLTIARRMMRAEREGR